MHAEERRHAWEQYFIQLAARSVVSEQQCAWDLYFSRLAPALLESDQSIDLGYAASLADKMLQFRNERFPPTAPDGTRTQQLPPENNND